MQQSSLKLSKAGTLFALLGLGLIGCSSGPEAGVYSQSSESGASRYTAVCEGVLPTPDLTLFDTLHFLRAGAQLVLSYDFATRAFMGTVENTTEATLRRVRVEVHLSNRTKLSLTKPVDLDPRHHPPGTYSNLPFVDRMPKGWLTSGMPTPTKHHFFVTTQESRMR